MPTLGAAIERRLVSNSEFKGKKALVTGASGFIGGHVRNRLLEAGADVLAIRRKGSPASKKGRSVEAEYDDQASLDRILREEKPDFVFHVAGATKGVTYGDFHKGNVVPTANLAKAVRDHHPKLERFVLVSSLSVFGPSTKDRPVVETDVPRPVEHYGTSKLEAEHALIAMGDGFAWTIVRPSAVYGPADVDSFELFKLAKQGLNVFYGNRHKLGSWIYVDDLVDVILLAATHPAAKGQGYVVDDGVPLTWDRAQAMIFDAFGKKPRTLMLPGALVSVAAVFGEAATKIDGKPRLFNRQKAIMGAQEAWTCDSAKLRKELGWSPKVQFADGAKRALEWYRAEKWL